MDNESWIGVDLDGTLAYYERGYAREKIIGDPILPILNKVKKAIESGIIVKIFTARVSQNDDNSYILDWLKKNGLPPLEITNIKDWKMIELWDDRCLSIEHNTGKILGGNSIIS